MKKNDLLKCRYPHCKINNQKVRRKEAIKDGNRYFHKTCYQKQEIKKQIRQIFVNKGFTQRHSNIALKQAIDDNGFHALYVLFIVKKFINQLNSPYNIMYYLNNELNKSEFKKIFNNQMQAQFYQKSKEYFVPSEPIKFKYKPPKNSNGIYWYKQEGGIICMT